MSVSPRLTWFALGAMSVMLVELALMEVWPGREAVARPPPVRAGAAAPAPVAAVAPPSPAPAPVAALPGPAAPPLPLMPDSIVAAGAAAAAVSDGQLMVPVRGVRPEQLVDTYTQARGQGRVHDAIDIPAPPGTPVLAAGAGTVLKLFHSQRGGIALYELAPDRHTIYYYAHLQRYALGLAEGGALRQGDVIGYVGDTGNAGAGNYHLHFEISTTADARRYWGGVPSNPYPRLRAGRSGA